MNSRGCMCVCVGEKGVFFLPRKSSLPYSFFFSFSSAFFSLLSLLYFSPRFLDQQFFSLHFVVFLQVRERETGGGKKRGGERGVVDTKEESHHMSPIFFIIKFLVTKFFDSSFLPFFRPFLFRNGWRRRRKPFFFFVMFCVSVCVCVRFSFPSTFWMKIIQH